MEINAQKILESIPHGLLVIDKRGSVVNANHIIEKIFNFSIKKLIGKNIKDIPLLKEICRGLNKTMIKRKIRLDKGRPRFYRLVISPLSKKRQIKGYIILLEDVTPEESLREAQKELTNLISQKLQVPINVIKDYVDLFLSGKIRQLPPAMQRLLQAAYQGNERLIRAINNVLDMLDLESPEFLIKKKKNVDLDKLIKEVISDFDEQAKGKGLKIIYQKPPKKIPYLEINPLQISKVLRHLIDNALKFTNKGSITISVKLLKNKLVVMVKDTGIGISAHDQKFLFQKFLRLKKVEKEEEELGLGLYICRMIIEKHGGEIWVKSKVGEGSTFSFSLPLK